MLDFSQLPECSFSILDCHTCFYQGCCNLVARLKQSFYNRVHAFYLGMNRAVVTTINSLDFLYGYAWRPSFTTNMAVGRNGDQLAEVNSKKQPID